MAYWRDRVFERDNYTCQSCGNRTGRLHAHHIKLFEECQDLDIEDLTNCITLCHDCYIGLNITTKSKENK